MELATQSEFDEVLNRHHNIQYVDAIFTDLCGYVRGKRFPVLEADKIFSDGVLLPFSAFYLDVLGGVTNTMNLGWTDGDPDGVLMPIVPPFDISFFSSASLIKASAALSLTEPPGFKYSALP